MLRKARGGSQSYLTLRVQMDRNYPPLIELSSSPGVRMLMRLSRRWMCMPPTCSAMWRGRYRHSSSFE